MPRFIFCLFVFLSWDCAGPFNCSWLESPTGDSLVCSDPQKGQGITSLA